MSTDRDISKFITSIKIDTNREVDEAVLTELVENLDKARSEPGTASQPNIWRVIMTSRITKLTVAAAILIVVLIGVTQFTGSKSGVAFADVIKPILNARTAIYTIVIGEEGKAPVIRDMVMGSRVRRTMDGLESVTIIDMEARTMLTLTPSTKKATFFDVKGLPEEQSNPLETLRHFLVKLQNNPSYVIEELGVQSLGGQEVIGFHAFTRGEEITIWADPDTALPVRIESQQGQIHVICTDLQFDVEMDESLFSMDVPEGYTLQQAELDLKNATEQDFIEGLRVWAEVLLNGEFPESVGVEYSVKQTPMIEETFRKLNLPDEEEMEMGLKLQRHVLFLAMFKGKGKWHYAGKGVKLGDADTAIFWYRPKGSETYRVIFGDLHVEDRAAEDLPGGPPAEEETPKPWTYQQWPKETFVGTEEDQWHLTREGLIVAHSRINLRKGPEGATTMNVVLPYADKGELQSVTCGEQAIEYRLVAKGQYELDLPMDKLEQGQTEIECVWTVPLEALQKMGDVYQTVLRSLIPVLSYKLEVVLDPDCGYVYSRDPAKARIPFTWNYPYAWYHQTSKNDFSSGVIAVRKQE